MIDFNDIIEESTITCNPEWPFIPDHPHRILIIGGSGSGKANAFLNLMNHQPYLDKIYQ